MDSKEEDVLTLSERFDKVIAPNLSAPARKTMQVNDGCELLLVKNVSKEWKCTMGELLMLMFFFNKI